MLGSATMLTSAALVSMSSTLTSCAPNADTIRAMALPTIESYTDIKNEYYIINNQTSLAFNINDIPNELTPEYPRDGSRKQMIRELFQNMAGEYYAKSLETPFPLASSPEFHTSIRNESHEIAFKFIDGHLSNFNYVTADKYPEAYEIFINDKITVLAFNEQGWMNAARTLLQLQVNNLRIPYGHISDWPKTKQRGIEIDFSGRGYPLSFVSDLIKTMSWSKLNTLALRFASGGMRLDCNKIDEAPTDWNGNGTWFQLDYHDYDPNLPSKTEYFNLNQNYRDDSPTWSWHNDFDDFGDLLNLAFKEGINIIPEVNIFTHAWFLTDLTKPKNSEGVYYPDDGKGMEDNDDNRMMKEKDFAIWDDRVTDDYPLGKRIPDSLDLREIKPGSKAAVDLCKKFLTYMANRFKSIGNYNKHAILQFGIGGDEYIETLDNQWTDSPNTWTEENKAVIVKSIYTFSAQMYDILKTNGMTETSQWSDSLLKQHYPYNDWPGADASDWQKIESYQDEVTIKHWWAKYGNASINDFVKPYETGNIGGGVKRIVNYNSDMLYFSDDESNTSTAPSSKDIFNNFHPGIFAGNAGMYQDNVGVDHNEYPIWLKGSMLSVWWDWSPHVATLIDGALKAFSQKCWNGTNKTTSFDQFSRNSATLGRAPLIGWN